MLAFAGRLNYNINETMRDRANAKISKGRNKMKNRNLSGISQAEFEEKQHILDVEKWIASERAGYDLCGTMTWCKYCVKAEAYPCAKAQLRERMESALNELSEDIDEYAPDETIARESERETSSVIAEEAGEEIARENLSGIPVGYVSVVRLRRSFRSKLIQNEKIQDIYTQIKNAILGYSGVKSRQCVASENFRVGRTKIAKLSITGKTLSLYLALSPQEFEDSKYRFEDVSEKRSHHETPMRVKITGSRTLKQAKELLDELAQKFGLVNVGCIFTDFHYPYQTDEELIDKSLIKPYTALVKIKQNAK